MNKQTFLKWITFTLIVLYFVSLFVSKTIPLFHLTLATYWFPALILFIGFYFGAKALLFGAKHVIWTFIVLFLSAVLLFFVAGFGFSWLNWWPVFLGIIATAFAIVGFAYKNMHDIKFFVSASLVTIPLCIYSFGVLSFWWSLLALLGSLYVNVFVMLFLPEHFIRKSKRKNGEQKDA